MDQDYFLGRMAASMRMARDAKSAVARLIHLELAGRYSVAAVQCVRADEMTPARAAQRPRPAASAMLGRSWRTAASFQERAATKTPLIGQLEATGETDLRAYHLIN